MALLGQSTKAPAAAIVKVPAGEDRLSERHITGISTTTYKVLTADSSGALFLFATRLARKAALPAICTTTRTNGSMSSKASTSPKLVRLEWNSDPATRFSVRAKCPRLGLCRRHSRPRAYGLHAANKMEASFRDTEKRHKENEYMNDAEVYRAYGMELLGPPLSVK